VTAESGASPVTTPIDVAPLVTGSGDPGPVAMAIDDACRTSGFFTIVGHGIDPRLVARLDSCARAFFARPESDKARIAMARGGRAWRGWFPLGGELTSGVPDNKEGLYFGAEEPGDPRPLHGANLFPDEPPGLRDAVLAYLDACAAVSQAVLRGIALALGLGASWFEQHLTAEPTVLLRIFRYPPRDPHREVGEWGVAEHTDYGLLTILAQDATGGLEIASGGRWVAVPPRPDALVCNLGDMLERMTGGAYRSTPHRVRAPERGERLSFPFFFDPSWDVRVESLPGMEPPRPDPARPDPPRWDGADPLTFDGTYGEYLTAKVAKVFPQLRATLG
jgi:isopenicillin N synthase-like dioxygenase